MVGVAEGGGTAPAADSFSYGEYYPPEHYFVPPEMCSHPQNPQHPQMCTVHTDYSGVGMTVVTSAAMMPQMLPPVMDDNMRHFMVHPHHQPQHHQPPHHQPPHHQPPHHQPPHHHQPTHHYGPANGAGGPQQFYGAGYPPPTHFHHMPPHHLQHSPPPPVYQKDERTQRQYSKLKQKLERKQHNRNNGLEINSACSTPALSPRKEVNGTRGSGSGSGGGASSGAWSEGEGSSAGASLHGDEDDTQAVLDLLSATRTPQVSEMTPTSALVQWNSPLPDGVTLPRVELTYDLLLGDRGRYKAIYSGPSLSCRVRDLRPGCEYSVCLQIRAGELTGAASEAATFRAPPAPPDTPSAPRITQRTRSSLLMRWPAAADNGSRLLHYILEMDMGEGFLEVAKPRNRQHTANNLRPQTCYRFRLAAVNECGRSAWSDDIAAWTTGAPPTAPKPPELSAASSTMLSLTWEKRTQEEEFTLQMDDHNRGHGFLPEYQGVDQRYECSGLRRASDYRFRLRCETTDGQGPWSSEVSYRTLPEKPGPPGRPTVRGKVHSRSFRLKWEAPTDDGGALIDSYLLELDEGDGYREAYSGLEREAHCDRLQPGTQYKLRVRCSNEAGIGDWSSSETITTDATYPGICPAPELVSKPRATSATVRWKPPECNGGAPITEYKLDVINSCGEIKFNYLGPLPECIIRELNPGNEYQVQVSACNKVGMGPPSVCLNMVTAAAPPDAPDTPVAIIESPKSARLEWNAPRDNGSPVLDYRLEISVSNIEEAFSEIFKGLETYYIVKNLVPFSPYFFRVSATNSAGRGNCSNVRDILMPRAAPAAPTDIHYEATVNSLQIFWNVPCNNGAEVLKYKVKVGESEMDTEGPVTEHIIDGLSPETIYDTRVAAINELGIGEWSEIIKISTRPLPPPPPKLECLQRAHNYVKLKWGEGAAPESTQYCLEMHGPDSQDFRPAYRGSARSFKIKKLKEATVYAFRIRASDERGGRGDFSAPFEVSTVTAPPVAPRVCTIELTGPRCATIRWETVERATYIVQASRGREPVFKQVYAGAEPQCIFPELEGGVEYTVRVCGVRGGLTSAWSSARLAVPAPPAPLRRRPRASRRLSPRHEALLLVSGFLLLAVLVAVLVQRVMEAPE